METRGVAKATAPSSPPSCWVWSPEHSSRSARSWRCTSGTGSELGFGPTRWFAGVEVLLGLILVIGGGSGAVHREQPDREHAVSGHVGIRRLLANWGVVYLGNAIGALSVVAMVYLAEWWRGDDLGVGVTALSTAAAKTSLPFFVVLVRASSERGWSVSPFGSPQRADR